MEECLEGQSLGSEVNTIFPGNCQGREKKGGMYNGV